jgi:5-methylcytosine-specific restriction endonuclease McrA
MTPLLAKPDDYLYTLNVMTSSEAKRLWRTAIKEKWHCTCSYCGKTYDSSQLTLDHVKPRALGGSNLTSNLVPSCRKCNQAKGSTNWLEFMRNTFGVRPDREILIQHWIAQLT